MFNDMDKILQVKGSVPQMYLKQFDKRFLFLGDQLDVARINRTGIIIIKLLVLL